MTMIDVRVPDIGDFKGVPIIEIHVKPGESVEPESPLITLESDKATMDVPSPLAGRVGELLVKIGDKVSEGTPILKLDAKTAEAPPVKETAELLPQEAPAVTPQPAPSRTEGRSVPPPIDFGNAHASPSVRRLARELDIDLTRLTGTGEKGRITKEDVKRTMSARAPAAPEGGGFGIPEIPAQDFSKFGPIEEQPLSRLKKLSGPHLHRAWLNVPHVTHTDEADITELESYRKRLDESAKAKGYRVTLLAFLIKASVACLKEFPVFNASLSPAKDTLILKKYYNIGVAVDTPDGLVVPVIKDANAKGIIELSKELGDVSARMRDGKITPADIQGGTFSISSLGGIGGINFTPIVNAPELAILGVVRSSMKPVWDGKAFEPRLMLPLCVSYDHRVIDGALAARFARRLAEILADVRELVL
jgi:pyruvate dehydrogenase E2 component (dihydrolipoyllysine-residue acetyltransferase)